MWSKPPAYRLVQATRSECFAATIALTDRLSHDSGLSQVDPALYTDKPLKQSSLRNLTP